jgi:predicted transcriptional regulator
MFAKAIQTPCEIITWKLLPVIRRELAKTLIKDHGLTQRKAAERLGLTEATVSRYISGKRAQVNRLNKRLSKEIKVSATRIIEGDTATVINETCRLCHLAQDAGVLKQIKT